MIQQSMVESYATLWLICSRTRNQQSWMIIKTLSKPSSNQPLANSLPWPPELVIPNDKPQSGIVALAEHKKLPFTEKPRKMENYNTEIEVMSTPDCGKNPDEFWGFPQTNGY